MPTCSVSPFRTARCGSRQLRKLAYIARTYDRGYGHFTTRTNIQFNWPRLSDVPAIIGHLNEVEMHSIQTSGNCIRNISTDQFAGAAADEIIDPRPIAEILRQWSSLHPEFSYLPRKFKIAMTAAPSDRAAIKFHDIGLKAVTNAEGEIGWEVWVGGGLGRTPMIAKLIRPFIEHENLLAYLREHRARLQPLRAARQQVQGAHQDPGARDRASTRSAKRSRPSMRWSRAAQLTLPQAELDRITEYFKPPEFERVNVTQLDVAREKSGRSRPMANGWSGTSTPTSSRAMPR